ncbi:MAG: hydrogenase maturation nickel metallochaperone HypA [bacterium]|nr:hydrogenase maturation nickel metallochaperone HypA [bacterium]
MHELDVTQSIVDALLEEMAQRNLDGITVVNMRCGRLTTFVPDSIRFYYESLTEGTKLEGSALNIEDVPVEGKCNACGAKLELADPVFLCAKCGSPDLEVVSGRELEITSIEVEEEVNA